MSSTSKPDALPGNNSSQTDSPCPPLPLNYSTTAQDSHHPLAPSLMLFRVKSLPASMALPSPLVSPTLPQPVAAPLPVRDPLPVPPSKPVPEPQLEQAHSLHSRRS